MLKEGYEKVICPHPSHLPILSRRMIMISSTRKGKVICAGLSHRPGGGCLFPCKCECGVQETAKVKMHRIFNKHVDVTSAIVLDLTFIVI